MIEHQIRANLVQRAGEPMGFRAVCSTCGWHDEQLRRSEAEALAITCPRSGDETVTTDPQGQ